MLEDVEQKAKADANDIHMLRIEENLKNIIKNHSNPTIVLISLIIIISFTKLYLVRII